MRTDFIYSTMKLKPKDWRVIRLYPDNSWEPVNGLRFKRLSEALARVAQMNDELSAMRAEEEA